MQKTNSAFLPMKLSKNKSHSSFCCTGCVKTNLALVETVSLMRLSLCYWATHRLLVIHVNHYCFIIENHSSSLYKSVGPSMHRAFVREREKKRSFLLLGGLQFKHSMVTCWIFPSLSLSQILHRKTFTEKP